jgi:hypothetical protein
LAEGRFAPGRDFRKDFSGEMKITLSSGKVLMPKICGQKRKFGVEVLSVSIPTS